MNHGINDNPTQAQRIIARWNLLPRPCPSRDFLVAPSSAAHRGSHATPNAAIAAHCRITC